MKADARKEARPCPNSYWVIDGRLAAGEYPRRQGFGPC